MNPEQQTEQSALPTELQEIMSHPYYQLALEIAIVKQNLAIQCLEEEDPDYDKLPKQEYYRKVKNLLVDLSENRNISDYFNPRSDKFVFFPIKSINPEAVQKHAEAIPNFDRFILDPSNKLHFAQDHAILHSPYLLKLAIKDSIRDYNIYQMNIYNPT